MRGILKGAALVILFSAVTGCATQTPRQVLEAEESQVKLRSMQSRSFDTPIKKKR